MSQRILVAEDNRPNGVLITALLTGFGYSCDLVGDGEAAVAAVAAGGYDLALLDVRMPRMDGIEAARRIRALPGGRRRIPVLALTADVVPERRLACLEAGMDGVLAKPIDTAELRSMISDCLRR